MMNFCCMVKSQLGGLDLEWSVVQRTAIQSMFKLKSSGYCKQQLQAMAESYQSLPFLSAHGHSKLPLVYGVTSWWQSYRVQGQDRITCSVVFLWSATCLLSQWQSSLCSSFWYFKDKKKPHACQAQIWAKVSFDQWLPKFAVCCLLYWRYYRASRFEDSHRTLKNIEMIPVRKTGPHFCQAPLLYRCPFEFGMTVMSADY